MTANPGSGATFDNWSGDASGTNNPVTVTMDGNKSVTANFSDGTGPNPEVTGTLIGTSGYTSTFFDAPSADGGWGNIAEVDFYGHDGLAKATENFTEELTAVTPERFVLQQNYPNPFNPSTKISYSLPKQSYVEIKVFDILGNEVAVLIDGNQPAGSYEIEFYGADLACGIYLCFIQAGEFSAMNKMILMK